MKQSSTAPTAGFDWRHYPWLLGVCLAPVLLGAVNPEGQVVVAALFGMSLLLLGNRIGGRPLPGRRMRSLWGGLVLGILVLPLVPLPIGLVEWLSPQRVALARAFPIEPGPLPSWMPLTLSPAQSLQRLWELALIVTAFKLSRAAAVQSVPAGRLVLGLGLALLFLGGSEVWFRSSGQERLLGLWPDTAGHGAGTFANRNHFANWLYVAALFAGGWVIRLLWPLQSARRKGVAQTCLSAKRPPAEPTGQSAPANSNPKTPPPNRHGRSADSLVRAPKNTTAPGKFRVAGEHQQNRSSTRAPDERAWAQALGLGGVLLISLVLAVGTGSRAGLASFCIGLTVWVYLLAARSRNPRRGLVLGALGFVGVLVLVSASQYLLGRLMDAGPHAVFKLTLWENALALAGKFWLCGVGPGAFATAFNHFKQFGGEFTFLHAENEWVQLLVEHGLVGGLVLGGLMIGLLARAFQFARRERLREPELVFGAVAALAAFTAHATLDFVFQVPANAILAAVLLGFIFGQRDAARQPLVVPPPAPVRVLGQLGWGCALLGLAGVQGWAWLDWQRAIASPSNLTAAAQIQQSLKLWPWPGPAQRHIALARARAGLLDALADVDPPEQTRQAQSIRRQLNQALSLDPFNWQLRLERAWLDLAFLPKTQPALAEAWTVVRLNPLQAKIPLRFARHFAKSDAAQARRFLRATRPVLPADIAEALTVAWSLDPNPAGLWEFVPATPAGLAALEHFARERKLPKLAAQARAQRAHLPAPAANATVHARTVESFPGFDPHRW